MFDWYLREWLKSTETSQAKLCELTGYPKAKVSELVNGKQRYNRDILNDISLALHLEPHELLMHPEDAMGLRQLKAAAKQIVRVPFGGVAVDEDVTTRKSA